MASSLAIERRGVFAVVRLNRPDQGNALDEDAPAELREAVDEAGQNADLRGIVLTGTGRHFCVGGDFNTLTAWRDLTFEERVAKYRGSQQLVTALQACPVPVVAALNGPAAGAGVDLALACDLRVAVPGASLTAAFAAVGLVPDLGGTWFLSRRVKRLDALRFLLGGRRLGAAEAAELGLIDQVTPDEQLVSTACDLIDALTANVPRAVVAETLLAIRGAGQHDLETSMALAARTQARLMSTHEHGERVAAFLAHAR